MERMEQIPQEIYDRIATHLGDTRKRPDQPVPYAEREFNRPVLATISRKWQRAIETGSFRALELKSTELDEFETIMTNARRRYLRVLRYYIVLPAYPAGSRQLFERHGDRTANDEAFSAAVRRLFRIFKSWEDQSSDPPGYSVQLHIHNLYSPTDYRFRSRSYVPSEEEQQTQYGNFGMRYRYSYIRILNPSELPIVSGIEVFEFHWRNHYHRKLAPQTFVEIAEKLPNLRKMWGELADAESRYPALRRRYRNGLVHAIESLSFPASIKHLSLNLQHLAPIDQAWQPTSLLHPGANHDSLSGAVWRATCHQNSLTTLYIKGVMDTSLLWPGTVGQTLAPDPKSPVPVEPFWQNLKRLTINFNIISPSGDWYFCAPNGTGNVFGSSVTSRVESETAMHPGYNSSEQEDSNASLRYSFLDEFTYSGSGIARIFRLVPDEPVLVPLIESFARACLQIPNLENATLATELWETIDIDGETNNFTSEWGIYFAAPANQSSWYSVPEEQGYPEEELAVPRLTFNTKNWRPDEDLCKLLRGIGGYGERLDEKHLDLWEIVEKPEAAERMERRRLVQMATLQT